MKQYMYIIAIVAVVFIAGLVSSNITGMQNASWQESVVLPSQTGYAKHFGVGAEGACEKLGCPYMTQVVGLVHEQKFYSCDDPRVKSYAESDLKCFFSREEAIMAAYIAG